MTHLISHRDLAPGKNNFDSSKSFFGFYLVIPTVNKRIAVCTDQIGPEIVGSPDSGQIEITEILLLGTEHKESASIFRAFLACRTIFMIHFEVDLRHLLK